MRSSFALLLCLFAHASCRMAYQLPDGYLEILGGQEPAQTFDCAGRTYGYYADVASGCRIFHVCEPVYDQEGSEVLRVDQYTFLCGNQTVFSQDTLVCSHADDAFACDQAETLYDSANAEFGVVVPTEA